VRQFVRASSFEKARTRPGVSALVHTPLSFGAGVRRSATGTEGTDEEHLVDHRTRTIVAHIAAACPGEEVFMLPAEGRQAGAEEEFVRPAVLYDVLESGKLRGVIKVLGGEQGRYPEHQVGRPARPSRPPRSHGRGRRP
jgi:hypothetical protein